VGIRCADHVTPLYPQKLVLTSPTGGGRSVGIVRSRTKAIGFRLVGLFCVRRQYLAAHPDPWCVLPIAPVKAIILKCILEF
jgi:hypothetical protein